MGLPDNRDIEPVHDGYIDGYNNQPAFVVNQIEAVEGNQPNEQMSEDESDENNGYLRLQTFENNEDQPANDSDSSESDEEDENDIAFNDNNIPASIDPEPAIDFPRTISAEGEIEAEVWNGPRPQDTIVLDTEKTQQILKAMESFTLPNVPQWANEVNPILIQRILRNKESPIPQSETHWNYI